VKKILNKCPICGAKLQYSRMMSFSFDSIIKRNGEPSAKEKKGEVGPLECGFISCTGDGCDFVTDCDLECSNYPYIKIWQQGCGFYYENENEDEY
jgi:hypothetical protein